MVPKFILEVYDIWDPLVIFFLVAVDEQHQVELSDGAAPGRSSTIGGKAIGYSCRTGSPRSCTVGGNGSRSHAIGKREEQEEHLGAGGARRIWERAAGEEARLCAIGRSSVGGEGS